MPSTSPSQLEPALDLRRSPLRLVTIGLAMLSLAAAPPARARVAEGETLEPTQLATLTGAVAPLLGPGATVNVILFWRPGQDASLDTLKQMAQCEKAFQGKPIHMVTVVSGSYPAAEVRAAVDEAGIHMPVLIDAGDLLYGKLEIRQHPLVVVADAKGKVALAQPYVRLRYCDIVHAHVRYLLKEIDAAQLQATLNPPAASMPSDDKGAVARRFVNMARMDVEAGHCERALMWFKKALELAPSNADAQAGLAACSGAKPAALKQ
jgi:hypothetical protein